MPNNKINAKLASMFLLHKGELSINDIEALPLIENENEVKLILLMLRKNFDIEIKQRRIESSEIPTWEEIILLKPKPKIYTNK